MNRSIMGCILGLCVVAWAGLAAERPLQEPQAGPAGEPPGKVARLLDGSGYQFTKVADNVWTIPFQGSSLESFTVIVSTQEDLVVMFVIPAKKAELKVSAELMRTLLQLNADLDRVKIGLDDSDDLFVRIDAGMRVMDVEEFKANVDQVSAAADEVHRRIKAHLEGGA